MDIVRLVQQCRFGDAGPLPLAGHPERSEGFERKSSVVGQHDNRNTTIGIAFSATHDSTKCRAMACVHLVRTCCEHVATGKPLEVERYFSGLKRSLQALAPSECLNVRADAHYDRTMQEPDVTRQRLLCTAMDIFARHGYHGASTRDICQAANVGNASIHYHFGDKQTLYRELYICLLDDFERRMRGAGVESLSGRDALHAYFSVLMRPLAEDPSVAQQIYLHLREEFEPTGIVDDLQPRSLELQFELLGGWLVRELGVRKIDAALQRLILALHGLALIYIVKGRTIRTTLPGVMEGANWLKRLADQLTDMGWGMVEAERKRRATAARKRLQAA